MPNPIRNVRGKGPNGWVRVTEVHGHQWLTDPMLLRFMQGETMTQIAYGCMPVATVESAIRWYLNHPEVMRRVLGPGRIGEVQG